MQLKYAAQPTPTAISKLAHTKIMKFACVRAPPAACNLLQACPLPAPCAHALADGLQGANHSLALDDKGAAFTWGARTPTRVVHGVACRPGAERAWGQAGNGGYGRLGHSVQQDEFSPRQVDTLKGRMPADPSGVVRRACCPQGYVATSWACGLHHLQVVLASPQVACGATSSFCTMVGGQLMAWGKLKTTDNTMYPKAFQDLSGWNVRSMACGASTYAVSASAGSEESTITWCALLEAGPAPHPPYPCSCMASCACHTLPRIE